MGLVGEGPASQSGVGPVGKDEDAGEDLGTRTLRHVEEGELKGIGLGSSAAEGTALRRDDAVWWRRGGRGDGDACGLDTALKRQGRTLRGDGALAAALGSRLLEVIGRAPHSPRGQWHSPSPAEAGCCVPVVAEPPQAASEQESDGHSKLTHLAHPQGQSDWLPLSCTDARRQPFPSPNSRGPEKGARGPRCGLTPADGPCARAWAKPWFWGGLGCLSAQRPLNSVPGRPCVKTSVASRS